MGTVSRVHTFSSGAVLTAAQLNNEFDNLLTSSAVNGGLDASNLGVSAGQVTASKALVVDSSRDLDDTSSSNQLNNLTVSGLLKTDNTTNATSTTDGSLQTDGGLSVALDAVIGDDLKLLSDSAVLSLGLGSDFTITHDGTTGATLAGNPIVIDSGDDLTLDAHTGVFTFKDAGTSVLSITESNSGDVTIKLITNGKDLKFTDNGDAVGLTVLDGAAGITVAGEGDFGSLDVSGNADIDGITNLDAVDIDGAVQIDGTVTVGVDDTGYDVKFFGATSGSSVLIDESADDVIFTNFGLAVGSDATGDIYYRNSSGYLARLAAGSNGNVLTLDSGIPSWSASSGGDIGGSTGSTDNIVLTANGTGGSTVQANSAVAIDDSSNISGVGTIASGAITATDTTAPLILKYDAQEFVTHAVSSAGVYSIATTDASSDSGAITLDTVDKITLDSDTADQGIVYADGGTELMSITNSSSDVIFKPLVDAKDIVIQQYDGNEVARFADNRRFYLYDEGGEYLSSDGSNLTIASGSAAWVLPASDGSANQVLKTNGSGTLSWTDAGGGAYSDWSVKTSNYTASTKDQLICNHASTAFTITLPSSPSAGNTVTIKNVGAATVTVGRNSEKINSQAEDGTLFTDAAVQCVYVDSTIGWTTL
tara:strand:+ start:5187 stop:7133 length:1947 start_codon:yes stop_codon:yes gene_type:complete